MTYLVDSDLVADYLSGRPPAVALLDRLLDEGLVISLITYGEIYEGITTSQRAALDEAAFDRFLEAVEVLPLDQSTMRLFARLRADLRSRGLLIPDTDLLIASTAVYHDLVLLTRNRRHFGRVPGLRLYDLANASAPS